MKIPFMQKKEEKFETTKKYINMKIEKAKKLNLRFCSNSSSYIPKMYECIALRTKFKKKFELQTIFLPIKFQQPALVNKQATFSSQINE